MNKAQSLVKIGMAVFMVTLCSSIANAQSGTKFTGSTTIVHQKIKGPAVEIKPSTTTSQPALTIDDRSDKQTPETKKSAARNCTTISSAKPYSITRKNFNKLPLSRQQFVLNNLNKYTIID